MVRKIKADTPYKDELIRCPHCGEMFALFLREDGRWNCHRCLTTFDSEGRIMINPMEVSDEEFLRHKRETYNESERWFLNLCREIWNEFFAGILPKKGTDDGSNGDK